MRYVIKALETLQEFSLGPCLLNQEDIIDTVHRNAKLKDVLYLVLMSNHSIYAQLYQTNEEVVSINNISISQTNCYFSILNF